MLPYYLVGDFQVVLAKQIYLQCVQMWCLRGPFRGVCDFKAMREMG